MVARNNADIARINNSLGGAGMMPSLTANGSGNFAQNNVDLLLSNQSKIQSTHGQTTAKATGIALSWVLFDGGKMFITKNKLEEIEALGEMHFRDTIQQTVYNVIVAYYNVVSQKQQLASVNEAITYNKEQVNILQTSFDAGLVAKTSLLQAKIDLNVYQESAINQQYAIISAKRVLNQIMARDSDVDFDVIDSISTRYRPDRNQLLQKLYTDNITMLSAQKQVEIARLSMKEFSAARLPRINLSGGYNLSLVDNTASNVLYNHSFGPSFGATLSLPIYQAGTIQRQVSTAKLQMQSASLNLENIKLRVGTQVQNALTQFDNQLELLAIEKENEALAKENIEIAIQRLRLGQSNSLEVRQAEESFVNSHTRRISIEYNLKIAETRLKQLVAGL
jgi:outer membrane protein TolC